ncbi:MAG: type III polyketide synthase [Lysobacteraceae bacterium]
MPILCKPAFAVPEFVLTYEQTLELAKNIYGDHPQYSLALRLAKSLGIEKRHLVRPVMEIMHPPGFAERNATYAYEAKKRIPAVVEEALRNAELDRRRIDAVVMVSCTGFVMPSLAAWMINALNFRPDVAQIPIAQLGCAAGGAAINRAYDYCAAHPGSNVLIVACEFCSLIYQPEDLEVNNLLSNALFGDAIASAVVRGEGGQGISLAGHRSYLLPDTEDCIAYEVKETGFHFRLTKGLAELLRATIPTCAELVASNGWALSDLGYYIIHTGGPRIIDVFRDEGGVPESRLEHSRATLREYGNVASASIFDVARRIFEEPGICHGSTFLIAGFGPGITAEFTVGAWS